ncbi:MAG: NusG domain II-containing protein [Clostridiales bacterium]|nr:NusG domain II-containing protein [Clostridiales bacterium]
MNEDRIKSVKNSKPFTVLDIIVAVILLIAVGIAIWLIYRTPPATVKIVSPNYRDEVRLDRNAVIELEALTVVIEDGCVYVTGSTCRDGTCEHIGKISRAGQSIVCLPNEVVISIVGLSDLVWEVG